MHKMTAQDWANLKAIIQTIMAGALLAYLLFALFTHSTPLDHHEIIDLVLVLLGLSTGVSNVGKARANGRDV